MFQSPIIKQKCNAIIFIISNINLCAMHWSSLCWVITPSWLSGSLRSFLYSPSMYSCHKEGWAPKNWCFQTVVLGRLLRVPWTAERSNQSILKEIIPEYSLEGLMLKLKLQYFDHLMQRADSLEKILMLEKIEGRRRRGNRGWDGWMASLTQWTWDWANSRRWWRTGKPGILQSMELQSQTQLSDRTTTCCRKHCGKTW